MSLAPVTWINSRGGRKARRRGDPSGAQQSRVTWVYAIAGNLGAGQIAGVSGVAGEPVRELRAADLIAVVGSVDAGSFGAGAGAGAGAGTRAWLLADLDRAELLAQAHHRVVACVAAAGPVLPMSLATVYPDDRTVRGLLAGRRAEFAATLEYFRGAEEWGVQVYLEDEDVRPAPERRAGRHPAAPTAPAVAKDEADPLATVAAVDKVAAAETVRRRDEGGRPGVRAHPAEQSAGRASAWPSAEAWAEAVDRALRGMTIAARRRQPPDPRFARPGGWLALNSAYLLDSSRAAEFAAAARALARTRDGARADLSGPWPPYSFADDVPTPAGD